MNMLRIDVLTLFPELVQAVVGSGVVRRAAERGLLQLVCWNPRDYTHDRHRTVDDRPYGGGPGMVMLYQPLADALAAARAADPAPGRVVCLSPQGRRLDQAGVEHLGACERLLLVAGRYEGIDERFIEAHVDEEWSIGDYVLSGGELPAMVLIDALTRQLPGALGAEDSAAQDSFMNGLLDCPHYTRPERIGGMAVPEVLLQGNHAAIERWRLQQALGRTWRRRPELLEQRDLTDEQRRLLEAFIEQSGNNDSDAGRGRS
ncbi:tRNA (guanosine(37)-N1)-methyltransferase TrmD [Thiohalobacter thiocyanaticus]|nr:tRNA (guanosine(37)-N1)-methyltransferase TrmD [Thiohalobacter thiocyanaticus]